MPRQNPRYSTHRPTSPAPEGPRSLAPVTPLRERPPLSPSVLADRGLDPPAQLPTIEVKSPSWHPHLFRRRLGAFDPAATHGDLVRVATSDGTLFGYGLFNPRAEIAVRLLTRGETLPDADWWRGRLAAAVSLRRNLLELPDVTDAYRLVHAEGDGLPGLVVDCYGPVLSAEVFSLAIWQRRAALLAMLKELTGAAHVVVRPGPRAAELEGFEAGAEFTPDCPDRVVITERGVAFEVDFAAGHKTGFFCDQRDNRGLVATAAAGRTMLDLCCYTGGFSLAAKLAGAAEVTGVDLDETAVAAATRNARRNRAQVKFTHSDAFPYLRDLARNERQFGLIVLDPPKLIASRDDFDAGRKTYFDLNRLALPLVEPGGLMLTCSCSGLMPLEEFQKTISAAAPAGRRVQILETRGAAADHPVATDCPESAYLKALWLRVE